MTIDPLDLRCTCGHEARVHREYTTESGSGCAHWLCPGCLAYDEMEGQQMSTDFPRPIEPGDIRVGDRVRREWTGPGGMHGTWDEVTIVAIDDTGLRWSDREGFVFDVDASWTLLDRPPPPAPPVGSHWCDPETSTEYVADQDGDYMSYQWRPGHRGHLYRPDDYKIIARLVRIDEHIHGDGCSPWLRDPVTGTGWVESAGGANLTHMQVHGGVQHGGYLLRSYDGDPEFAARLVPWGDPR